MSVDTALRFLEFVATQPELQQEIATFKGRTAIESLRALAAGVGFAFSEDDYRAAIVKLAEGELSEEAIRDVQRELGVLPE